MPAASQSRRCGTAVAVSAILLRRTRRRGGGCYTAITDKGVIKGGGSASLLLTPLFLRGVSAPSLTALCHDRGRYVSGFDSGSGTPLLLGPLPCSGRALATVADTVVA